MSFGGVYTAIKPKISSSEPIILLDTFSAGLALASRVPDIAPVGSSWNVLAGTWGTISGGVLPYSTGNNGKAVINIGVSNFEMKWRAFYHAFSSGYEFTGILFRSNSSGTGRLIEYYMNGAAGELFTGNHTGVILHDTAVQAVAYRYPFSPSNDTWYDLHLICNGNSFRLYNSAGALRLASVGDTFTGTYIGLSQVQGGAGENSKWDNIKVTPLLSTWKYFSVVGDSISNDAAEWPGQTAIRYKNGLSHPYNKAAVGATISAHMNGQITSCIADAADFTIIALGTNDSGSPSIQTRYHDEITRLYNALHKPIYCMNILNKTPDTNRATVNSQISAAVADASGDGVNCLLWDTEGWIDPAIDTGDGLHPNAAGQLKIATQVLARLP